MTEAEQFLADLEAKAKAATHQGEWVVDDVPFTHGYAIRDANDDIVRDDGSAGGEYTETTTIKKYGKYRRRQPRRRPPTGGHGAVAGEYKP